METNGTNTAVTAHSARYIPPLRELESCSGARLRARTQTEASLSILDPPSAILFDCAVASLCRGRLPKNSKEDACSPTTAPYAGRRSGPVLASG